MTTALPVMAKADVLFVFCRKGDAHRLDGLAAYAAPIACAACRADAGLSPLPEVRTCFGQD